MPVTYTPYYPGGWNNAPTTSTPIVAAALDTIDAGIGAVAIAAPDWFNAKSYGAVGDGTTDDTTAIQAAITACIAAYGGIVYLPSGTYKTSTTITADLENWSSVSIVGDGQKPTTVAYHGTGACFRMYNPNTGAGSEGSGFANLTIDGTNASGSGATGLHIGDITELVIHKLTVQNFAGTGGIGINFDNTVSWTEEADVRASISNCTQMVVFQITTGYGSFGYGNFDFSLYQSSNQQSGVCLLNGSNMYHGSLRIRGNFVGGTATTTAAVIYLAGLGPSGNTTGAAGQQISLSSMHMDVQVECTGGTYFPYSMWFDSSGSWPYGNGNYGTMDFGWSSPSFAPAVVAANQWAFTGIIVSDTTLNPSGSSVWMSFNVPVACTSQVTYSLGCSTNTADMFYQTLSADSVVSLTPYGTTLGIAQRVTIVLTQAASGGPYTVTWPKPSSPTTASPAVYWAGGTAPTMTTAASAVDVYKLETMDGIHWYGEALQNMS